MSDFLIRLFVKDYKNVKDPAVRNRYGMFAGIFGIVCNLTLSLFKIITGLITGTMSIVGDSVNNMSDMFSSVITLIGFKISGKAADKTHPYGHGRIEYLTGLTVAVAVLVIALGLLKSSVEAIITPSRMDVDIITIIILVVSILIKIGMSFFYYNVAGKINSSAMRATASDSRSDCLTTSVALLAVIVKIVWDVNIDGYAGVIVAIVVLKAGFDAAKENFEPLLGSGPDSDVTKRIEEIALSHEEIVGVHDIRVHDYGPANSIASMHVEIPAEVGLIGAHEVVDIIESEIEDELLVGEITIHVDPVIKDDQKLDKLRLWTVETLKKIDPIITMHDFRITSNGKRVAFELEVPYNFPKKDEDIRKEIDERFKETYPDLNVVVVAIDKV